MQIRMQFFLALTLSFAAFGLGCQTSKPTQIAEATPKPPITTPKIAYTKPTIGMGFIEFSDLCKGKRRPGMRHESAYGTTSQWVYEYSDENAKNDCYGIFTFRDGKLESIGH